MIPSEPGVKSPLLLAVLVAVAGAGTMIVELSAVRLLAPWFGASAAVWTNVIGVVLCALSLGYLIGARLSAGSDPERSLAWVLSGGAISTLLLPACAPTVAEFFLGAPDLALEQTTRLFAWGSLAGSLCLFTPAALFLGCVGPLAVELLQRSGVAHAGTAGGRVLFASTLGSLIGTFATTHLFLPELGLSKTFLFAGGAIAACALVVLVTRRKKSAERSALMILLPLTLIVGSGVAAATVGFDLPDPKEGTVLERSDSAYQTLAVVERSDFDPAEPPIRLLQVNEGLDSFQSIWRAEPGLLPTGYYYNYFAPPLAYRLELERQSAPRVAVIGFGAGTVWRVLDGLYGDRPYAPELIGVEIDPEVIALGERWFELPLDEPRLTVMAGRDGRAALRDMASDLDLVVLDAYANQTEIPAHLSTLEFFGEVKAKLAPGGFLAANVGGFGLQDPVVEALARTIAQGFDSRVLALSVPFSRNVALWAVREEEEHRLALPGEPDFDSFTEPRGDQIAALLEPVSLEGTWRVFEPGAAGEVATDDKNPIERLQSLSLARGYPLGEETPQ